jgi:hypothetical protein
MKITFDFPADVEPSSCRKAMEYWAQYITEFAANQGDDDEYQVNLLSPHDQASCPQHPTYGAPLWEQGSMGECMFTEYMYSAPDDERSYAGMLSTEGMEPEELVQP